MGDEQHGEGERNSGPGDDGIGDVARVALPDVFEVLLDIMNRRRRRNASEPIDITARSSGTDQI